ncbi:MAG: peptidase M23 [Desulfovibrio sp.]|nr:peptidase M23 [Desulfovibrio sp.]
MLLFDSVKKLEKAFTKEQFDALVDLLDQRQGMLASSREIIDVKAALKADIVGVRNELKNGNADVRNEVISDIAAVRSELKNCMTQGFSELRDLESRLKKVYEPVHSEIKSLELRFLRWPLGVGIALLVVMAKGFGWIGF